MRKKKNSFSSIVDEEKSVAKKTWGRIKRKDFSGNQGQAIKNSSYQVATTLVAKIGSLLFMIIIARLLLPELFGLYSLALSTIIFFLAFSDLGISSALVRFLSKEMARKKGNPLGYFIYLRKLKVVLTILASLALVFSAYFISNSIYNKPLLYALLAGGFYIIIHQIISFLSGLFHAENNFRKIFIKEIIFQVIRLMIVPLIILLTISRVEGIRLLYIFLGLIFAYLISSLFLILSKHHFKGENLTKEQKKGVNKFLLPLSATVLSGVFLGSIDQIMLGRFVASEFIGYYAAAFALVSSAGAIITFSPALLPIFSRLNKENLESSLKKAIQISALISVLVFIITIIISKQVVLIVYGGEYSNSILLLQIITPLLITLPLTGIYANYFIAKGRTVLLAKLLVSTTILNIILNYVLITLFLSISPYYATIGAAIATVVSRGLYLGGLIIFKK